MATQNHKKTQRSPTPTKRTRESDPAAQAPTEPSNRPRGLTVVGIGASAGGLTALQSFFSALPSDTGIAFVVVTHLHPEHESHMAELLQKQTQMPTMQVMEKVRVEPNHVYVIPPNRGIIMADSHLETMEFTEPHGQRTPIDHFFRSLAGGHSDSVAVILSGGGTDGSVGIKDVKEQGGLILVQHPDDAEYDSMPRAAISTGLADMVLPAAQLAEKLVEYIRHSPRVPHDPGQLSEQESETLQRILAQVHARTGHDFNQYKRSTILRRVERRMQLNGYLTLEAYLNYLRHNANEAQAMFNDILIGVTNFFRDRASWAALEETVIPALCERKNRATNEIRVWSIGCATGEEAYSLAILLFEYAARLDFRARIQVFASDLDEHSIAHAREGLYPTAIEADVTPERLERFFTREGEYYRVKREIRDAVLFANHNLLRDPAFSRQDLIACRNVLIYLQRSVQEQVFEIFHYALNPEGYLFLGTSESAEHIPDIFNVIDKHHRIYQARPWIGEGTHVPMVPLAIQQGHRSPELRNTRHYSVRYLEEPALAEEQHRRALEMFGPPSVLVNDRYTILHISETAGRYLLLPKGPITGDLLKLVRPELQLGLRSALFQAFEKNQATVSRPARVQFNSHARSVVISVRPRAEVGEADGTLEKQALVLFLEDEVNESDPNIIAQPPSSAVEQGQITAQLQAEVQRLREQLQITVEEYDSSNEEMKAANEELQSINEEYRSATEELETSKEELQSVNEELQTVNSEMRSKLEELTRAHQELENLMGATDIPTLFLDREMRIQRYTAGVKGLFSILQIDRGRRISDLSHKLGYSEFTQDAERVLHSLVPTEREVQLENGMAYLIRLRPYRTTEDKIEGVAITFIDITALKQAERELIQAKELLEERVLERTRELDEANQRIAQARDLFSALFHANPIPTSLTRLGDGLFIDVNDAYLNYYGFKRGDLIGHTSAELHLPLDPSIRPQLMEQVQREGVLRNVEVVIEHPFEGQKTILTSLQLTSAESTPAVITAFIDITERVRAEQQIRALASELTVTEQTERHRVAQILHDDLQQRIFAIQMQMGFLRDAYEKNDLKAYAADFPQMESWLTEAIQVTRQLSVDLSPPILHGEGLIEAVLWLAAQMKEQYGLEVNIQAAGKSTEFDEKVRMLVFYAVRELLFNVVKHAGTLKATVAFEHGERHLRVTVSDHGKGFNEAEVMNNPQIAHGLLIIRHRLNLLGCSMDINSQPGTGTEIVIEIPYEKMDS